MFIGRCHQLTLALGGRRGQRQKDFYGRTMLGNGQIFEAPAVNSSFSCGKPSINFQAHGRWEEDTFFFVKQNVLNDTHIHT